MASKLRYALQRRWHGFFGWGRKKHAQEPKQEAQKRIPGIALGVKRPPGSLYLAPGVGWVRAGRGIRVAASTQTNAADGAAADEVGISGLDVRFGRIYDDYNADLTDLSKRMARYEEMRRSDTAVATVENLISLPVRAAIWDVVPGEGDESEEGRRLAERLRRNLFEELTHSFDDLLRLALLAPLYGFTLFEQVWEQKSDGIVGWRKFADRDRSIIKEWVFDETGGVQAVKIAGWTPDKTRKYVERTISIDKLLLFTWREEAGNPEGLGLLRQAHKPVAMKAMLEEIACIRLERQALGIPIAYRKGEWWGQEPEIDAEEAEAVLEILEGLRANENVGAVCPAGWTIEMLSPGPADVPFETLIERQHQYILQTMLAQFVGFSQGGDRGSFGLSKDASSLFLYCLGLTADWICDTFNRYAVSKWMEYNAPEYRPHPRLTHGPIGVRDTAAFGNTIRALFDRNVNVPRNILDRSLEELGLPPLSQDDWNELTSIREAQLIATNQRANLESTEGNGDAGSDT
mgnify:CR=1 FL=1